MTEQELIAKQALQIAELQELLTSYIGSFRRISMELYGIGQPLNDNKLGYTREQLQPFFAIAKEIPQ